MEYDNNNNDNNNNNIMVVVGTHGVVSNRLDAWLEKQGVTIRMGLLHKTALLGTARILRMLKEKKSHKGPLAIDFGSLLWCNVSITSTGEKRYIYIIILMIITHMFTAVRNCWS